MTSPSGKVAVTALVTVGVAVAVFWSTNEYARDAASLMQLRPTDDAILGAAIALTLAAATGSVTIFRIILADDKRAASTARSAPNIPTEHVFFGMIPQEAHAYQARPFEMGLLRSALSPAASRSRPGLVALIGQRGVGKTQLAAAYARKCLIDGYELVAWINADGVPTEGLARLAEDVNLRATPEESPSDLAAKIRPLLERLDHVHRLVVFDDVDHPDSIMHFLPAVGNAEVVITSNEQTFADADGVTVVPVGMFTVEQARSFLRAATDRPDDDDAFNVGVELGWLPLALAQAAALIRRQRYTYSHYLSLLRNNTIAEALPHTAGGAHTQGAVRAAILTIDDIARRNSLAERLLEVLSLLGVDGVRRRMLLNGAGNAAFPTEQGAIHGAIGDLADASLLSYGDTNSDEEEVTLLIHRVTARVVRERCALREAFAEAVKAATILLGANLRKLPRGPGTPRSIELDELVAHAQALRGATHGSDPEVLDLCSACGNYMQSRGDLTGSIAFYEQILDDRERVLGSNHRDTLNTRKDLATAFRQAGRLGRAMTLFEETMTKFEAVLGTDHPDTLRSRDDLAIWYWIAGRLHRAVELFEQNLVERERVLGAAHAETIGSRNNLALAYVDLGKIDTGIQMHMRNIEDTQGLLGPDSLESLGSRNNLALALLEAGRTNNAIDLLENVAIDRERILGRYHIATLGARNNLGLAYLQAGRQNQGVDLLTETLADRDRVLGPEHPNTLGSLNNLALALQYSGKIDLSVRLHERALTERERFLGPRHPDVFGSRSNLAIAYLVQGHPGEAIRLLEQTVASRETVMGPDHPETAGSRRNLDLARSLRPGGAVSWPGNFHINRSVTRSVPIPPTHAI